MSDRFEPRALPDGGVGIWDAEHGRRLEQPGLDNVYWFTSVERAQTWIARQETLVTRPRTGARSGR